jgi:hypothetical protein
MPHGKRSLVRFDRRFDCGPSNGRNRVGFRMPAGRERLNRGRGRRPKASDERTRGKAVSARRAMGIWRRSGCRRGGFCEDRRALRAGDYSGEFAAAALDGLIGDWSVMPCRRWQAPG